MSIYIRCQKIGLLRNFMRTFRKILKFKNGVSKYACTKKCQMSDECSNNERLWLDEMHILKMVVKFCTKLSFTVF